MKKKDHEDIKRALREACGIEDPVVQNNNSKSNEEVNNKVLWMWNVMMSKIGIADNLFDKDKN